MTDVGVCVFSDRHRQKRDGEKRDRREKTRSNIDKTRSKRIDRQKDNFAKMERERASSIQQKWICNAEKHIDNWCEESRKETMRDFREREREGKIRPIRNTTDVFTQWIAPM